MEIKLEKIGENLRAHRAIAQLSRSELSKATGFSEFKISAWEKGERDIPVTALMVFADFYGTTIDKLCGRTEKR